MEEDKYWIWVSRLKNIRNTTIINLLQKYKSIKNVYNLTDEQLLQNKLNDIELKQIQKQEYKENLEKYFKYMNDNNIEIISIQNNSYPAKLKTISDPPIVLFVKGNKQILNQKSIAIVGCRDASPYGKQIAENMAYNLSKNNINVISGLAIGVDSYAHIGAIKMCKNSGKTIAVIGSGIDNIYPKQNIQLANAIIKSGGAIISEYIIGTKPEKIHFPARNRIISALSDGVLVIEAKEKSGTLITVDFALEQGKDVYVIPGNINNINSVGTNKLLKQGANPVTQVEDIINNLNVL